MKELPRMGARKKVKHQPTELSELNKLVEKLFVDNSAKITKLAHGKRSMSFAVESEILAFENKAEHARIIVERTKEGSTVPEDFDVDYTIRIEYTDLGIVVSVTRSLEIGLFPDMYIRHASFVPVETQMTDAVFDRALAALKAAKITDYKPELDEHEDETVEEIEPPVLDGEMDIVPDEDEPGPDDIVDLVAEEGEEE